MAPHGGDSLAFGRNDFPALGLIPKQAGRFLVITRTDEGETLQKVSPFLVAKVIKNCCGDVASVKRMRDGKILVETKTERQAVLLMKLNALTDGINVCIKEHNSLNNSKVVITCREIMDEEDDVILENLKDQNVIKVERIYRRKGEEKQKTATFILTVGSISMPKEIKIAYMKVNTRPYYPRPIRCFNCFRFGHVANNCQSKVKICRNCSKTFHGDQCSDLAKCINCGKAHESTSADCEVWTKEKEIIQYSVDKGISRAEAKKIIERSSHQSYTNILANGINKCNCKCTCGEAASKSAIKEPIPTTSKNITLEITDTLAEYESSSTEPQPTEQSPLPKRKKVHSAPANIKEPQLRNQKTRTQNSTIEITRNNLPSPKTSPPRRRRGRSRKNVESDYGGKNPESTADVSEMEV